MKQKMRRINTEWRHLTNLDKALRLSVNNIAQYFAKTSIPDFYCCVVMLCLTFFLFLLCLVKFLLSYVSTITLW